VIGISLAGVFPSGVAMGVRVSRVLVRRQPCSTFGDDRLLQRRANSSSSPVVPSSFF
jgi:hypothetical protein